MDKRIYVLHALLVLFIMVWWIVADDLNNKLTIIFLITVVNYLHNV
jgi:hypothetical protein